MFGRNNLSELTDEDLLFSNKESGNSIYMGELFNRYLPLLYGVCLKYLKDADNARDAVMQLFENLLYKITDYEIDTFRPWIYSVVKNHCLQILQKEDLIIKVDINDDTTESDSIANLFEEEGIVDRSNVLKNCLNKLPEKQQVSITYFFIDGLSYAEIVEKTGYKLKNVKSYIQNGKRNLKNCIEKKEL